MSELSYWIIRFDNQVLIQSGDPRDGVFLQGSPADFGNPRDVLLIGQWRGKPIYAADLDEPPHAIDAQLINLRALYGHAGDEAFALAGRATQLIDWHRQHRFCGRCGTATFMKSDEFAMQCPSCALVAYPRISPAVMVLVRRGNDLLLARSPHFKPGVFSALAGFVEPGETLEQCAQREVLEEVNVQITNLRYFRSQSWPFPNSLMLAFFADYVSGEINPDPREIEAAAWFSRDNLPRLPDRVSIARRLIDAACASEAGE